MSNFRQLNQEPEWNFSNLATIKIRPSELNKAFGEPIFLKEPDQISAIYHFVDGEGDFFIINDWKHTWDWADAPTFWKFEVVQLLNISGKNDAKLDDFIEFLCKRMNRSRFNVLKTKEISHSSIDKFFNVKVMGDSKV